MWQKSPFVEGAPFPPGCETWPSGLLLARPLLEDGTGRGAEAPGAAEGVPCALTHGPRARLS